MDVNDDYFAALETRSINSIIDQHIYLAEDNRELAYLGAVLLNRALNILTSVAPVESLRKAILDQLCDKEDRYDELISELQKFTPVKDMI